MQLAGTRVPMEDVVAETAAAIGKVGIRVIRARKAYGIPSQIGKSVILANEKAEGRITLIHIGESPGY